MSYKYDSIPFDDMFLAASSTAANNESVSAYKVNSTSISFYKPQGSTDYFKSSYGASTTTLYYSILSSNLFAKFAPRTTKYDSTGDSTHTFHSSTKRWSILLLAGGGGGEGGVQYSGDARGAGGGGGASGTWCFAYSTTLFNSLTVTIGTGGVGGENGGDLTTEYQYPGYHNGNKKGVDCTAGGNSLITALTTTLLTVYGGDRAAQKRTNGQTGGAGGGARATGSVYSKDTSMTVIDASGGVSGGPGSDQDVTPSSGVQAQGGSGGVNTVAATIGITNKLTSFLDIDTKGNGGNGGRGEGTSGNGAVNGSAGNPGLAVIMEYFF